MNPPASTTLNPGGSVLAGLRILKRELVVVGIFSFVTNVLMLSPTLYMLQIFDRVMASRNELTLLFVSLLTLALFMVIGFCEWSRSKLLVWAGMRFDALFSQPIFSATHRQALAGESRNPGVALAALTNLRQFVTGIGIFAFFDLPWTPIYLAFMFLLHPVLGLVGTLFVLNLGLLFWLTHYVTTKPAKAAADEDKEVQSFLHNHLRAAEVVESMGLRANFLTAWRARNAAAVEATRGVTLSEGRLKSVVHLVRTLQQSFLLGLGGFLVIRGELHMGAMIAANVLLARASYPLDMMVGSWKGLIQALQASNTLNDLLGQFGAEPNGRRHKGEAIGNVHVDRVTARAKTLDRPILDQLELHFQPGEIVAVVGPSGSGKSTLMKVLAGIWPMTTGAVKIDGIATHDWDREVLGRQLGYLPQEIDLYGGTFAENIARFGEVDPDAVIAAAQRATIHDLLLRFPNGYDTPVLEGGMNLSAGQRQRVALARALYGSPAIVLLDEPNAHLDDVGESALQRALLDLKSRQATVIVASHRSNILSVADRLLMLRDGRVVYDGPPQGSPSQLHAGGALPAP